MFGTVVAKISPRGTTDPMVEMTGARKEARSKMKRINIFLFSACALLALSGCSGHMRSLSREEIRQTVKMADTEHYAKLHEAQQAVDLALEYYEQGGYRKGSELFLEAADLYGDLGLYEMQRRALIAAAKLQLKCSQRTSFLLTVERFERLLGRLEMPSEDERFLINLSDHMKGRPLTYPVEGPWEIIFKKNELKEEKP